MEKTDLMKEYEIKIDSIVNWESYPIGYTRYLASELLKARLKAEAYDRLSEKVGVWANGMNARFFNPMDFVFCSQQVAEEMKEYADGKE